MYETIGKTILTRRDKSDLCARSIAAGALAIGRLAIRLVVLGSAAIDSLKLKELEVELLRAGNLVIADSLVTPSDDSAARLSVAPSSRNQD